MQLPVNMRATLVSAAAAALLAACGGGGSTPDAASAQAPMSAELSPQSAAVLMQGAPGTDTAPKGPQTTFQSRKIYIVQLADAPASSYAGQVAGIVATAVEGQKINKNSAAVRNYLSYLAGKHDAVLRSVGASRKVYSYGVVFNGFAAEMTDDQAKKAAAMKGVVSVVPDETRHIDTASTPAFLGLTGNTGFYAKTGNAKGEGVVIGMIDTGVWPENVAFSDAMPNNSYSPLSGWGGSCDTGADASFPGCNNKLVGAKYYNNGWFGNEGIATFFPEEFLSPRDYAGHGSHTSSTAGGNENVTITGPLSGYGHINGIAPRARLAMYKVCWGSAVHHPAGSGVLPGCQTSDSMAAIEDAIADGVDVINYSISGSVTSFIDPVEVAFLEAARAGVFVAASAGNSGPAVSTVAHPSPWITTVAAGTHNRSAVPGLNLAGTVYGGASNMGPGAPVTALMTTGDASVVAGGDVAKAQSCYGAADNGGTALLDPVKVSGKIVVCDRGTIGFANKALAVSQAGGVGVVFVNVPGGNQEISAPPATAVPAMKIALASRAAIRTYAGPSNASGTMAVNLAFDTPAPFTASFSSRGPSKAVQGNILKPDLMAPGVDILAAVAPTDDNAHHNFDSYQGTSMSSPHVAGIAALFKQAKPKWSPMAIKSALMTTAYDVIDGGANTDPLVIFKQGAGFVRPVNALDPGLVFDSNAKDWLGFICGTYQVPATTCTGAKVPVLEPFNMNMASIAVGTLAGAQTVTRRVTNVGTAKSTYTASVTPIAGYTITVSPASFAIAPGQTKSFDVTFTRTTAPLNAYLGGQLTLADGTHNVRVPIVLSPVVMRAPADVPGTTFNVKFGYTGNFTATQSGPVTPGKTTRNLAYGASTTYTVDIPASTALARFATFASDYPAGTDVDIELRYAGNLVGTGSGGTGLSNGGTADESIDVVTPAAGTYTVKVTAWSANGSPMNANVYNWTVVNTPSALVTMTAPTTATNATAGAITFKMARAAPSGRYLGVVSYSGTAGLPGPTVVHFDR